MKKFTFYVSPDGCDENAGNAAEKFKTIERAQKAARDITALYSDALVEVIVEEGVYFTRGLSFDERDSGHTYKACGNAVITGGITVSEDDFSAPCAEILDRLSDEAKKQVRAVDLKRYGFTENDWGDICAIGAYNTASQYDNGKIGVNMEVFSNNRRMKLARYPNGNEFLKIEAVMDVGDVFEFPPQNYFKNDRRNNRPGTYIMDRATNERVKLWKTPNDAWLFGYLFWDWADSSTPVQFDTYNRLIKPEYVSRFGCRSGALYYIYNVLEELDEEGEWYLDRNNGMLYFYPYASDGADNYIDISISTKPLISGNNVCGMTLEGFTLKCTRSDGIVLSGESNDNIIRGINVTNIAGNAVSVTGYRNLIENCDISHTGKGGIQAAGGDTLTLTPGENVVTNNYIHDFSEVYLTYQSGVSLHGVGNTCSHNEICGSPHMAILYSGNDELIEYNYIHDVVLQSSDAGAIYAGFSWTAHGCVVRYNLLEDIGGGKFTPDGIYWDDGLSGQSAYGNILINVKKYSFLVGGGRDCEVFDNVIINPGIRPILYDDRNRDGFVNGGWARAACNTPESAHWVKLRSVPYKEGIWAEKYPAVARLKTDFAEYDDPDFPINPAYSVVRNNVIIDAEEKAPDCAESVYRYSTVENNAVYKTAEEAGFSLESLRFEPERPDFIKIETDKIGRTGVGIGRK